MFGWLTATVASYIDAWIEIAKPKKITKTQAVASYIDAWIEIKSGSLSLASNTCRILYRCVD